MTTKRKTLTGWTDRPSAPTGYMEAVAFGLYSKPGQQGINTGRKRSLRRYQAKMLAHFAEQDIKVGRTTPPHGKKRKQNA